jgi:hypothetical protein
MSTRALRKQLPLWILGAAAMLLAANQAAGASYVNFTLAVTDEGTASGETAAGVYQLPPGDGSVLVKVGAYGVVTTTDRGTEGQCLYVRLTIEDHGNLLFTVDPSTARLTDDEGHRVSGADLYAGQTRLASASVSPGGRDEVQLGFALPPDRLFADIGSLTVEWAYRYGDQQHVTTVNLVKGQQPASGAPVAIYVSDAYAYGDLYPLYGSPTVSAGCYPDVPYADYPYLYGSYAYPYWHTDWWWLSLWWPDWPFFWGTPWCGRGFFDFGDFFFRHHRFFDADDFRFRRHDRDRAWGEARPTRSLVQRLASSTGARTVGEHGVWAAGTRNLGSRVVTTRPEAGRIETPGASVTRRNVTQFAAPRTLQEYASHHQGTQIEIPRTVTPHWSAPPGAAPRWAVPPAQSPHWSVPPAMSAPRFEAPRGGFSVGGGGHGGHDGHR